LRSLARRYSWADTHDEVVATTVEAALHRIRNYPLRTRPHRIAANVIGDTKGKLFRRFTDPVRTTPLPELLTSAEHLIPSAAEELASAIQEAVRVGRLSPGDGSPILQTRVFDRPVDALANEAGVGAQTLRRRRLRAEARLVDLSAEVDLSLVDTPDLPC
jgi:hypothetical protein